MREVARTAPVLVVNSLGLRMPRRGVSTNPSRRILRKLRSMTKFVKRPLPDNPGFHVMTPLLLPFYGDTPLARLNAWVVRQQVRLVALQQVLRQHDPARVRCHSLQVRRPGHDRDRLDGVQRLAKPDSPATCGGVRLLTDAAHRRCAGSGFLCAKVHRPQDGPQAHSVLSVWTARAVLALTDGQRDSGVQLGSIRVPVHTSVQRLQPTAQPSRSRDERARQEVGAGVA